MLEKTNQAPKTNAKGDVKKFDKSRAKKKA